MNHITTTTSTRCIPSTHRAICTCGYRGPGRSTRDAAETDVQNHKRVQAQLAVSDTTLDLLEEGAMFDKDDDPDWVEWSNRAIRELQKYGRLQQVIVDDVR